jgi:hypothetical protein
LLNKFSLYGSGAELDIFEKYAAKLCIVKASEYLPISDGAIQVDSSDKDLFSQQSVVGVKKNGELFFLNLSQFSESYKRIKSFENKNKNKKGY